MNPNNIETRASESKPDLISQFDYRDAENEIHNIDLKWYDIPSKADLPNLPWQQVYIVGNLNNTVPLVQYPEDPDNLPGGRTEPGETIEETAIREAEEEMNCKLLSWEPLGYQSIYENGNLLGHQLRIYAELEKIADFEKDPGGPVISNRYIQIDQLADQLNWPDVGQRLQDLAKKYFSAK